MIVSRAPTRISLGGGATDLASYYSKHGGFLIAGAINKYCNIVANRRFDDNLRVSYSEMEICGSPDDLNHRIFKAGLKFIGIEKGIELHSVADVPAGCGLGSSSTFTVALLNALHAYQRDYVSQRQLAEEACHLEIDVLGEPIGKQDQYMAAFGGLTCLTFEKDGTVIVEPLRISSEMLDRLENNLLLFYTGKQRSASAILVEQDEKSKKDDNDITKNLHQVKQIGLDTRNYLEKGDIDKLGELFDVHWNIKKQRSKNMSDSYIDECYEEAKKAGAIGGKVIGAGGGGFLMLYCSNFNHDKTRVLNAMIRMGLRWERFRFDHEGAKILINT